MRSEHLVLASVLAFASVLVAEADASAFCRTTTVPSPPDGDPAACSTQGVPLYHPSQCLPYRLLATESPIISNAILSEKLAAAFGAWTAPTATCAPGITAIELAPVAETTVVGYQTGTRGRNVVGVVVPWTHTDRTETLSLATLTFAASTGEIYDVDLEVNGDVKWSFTEPTPPDAIDLQSVLTHEVGHVLGFAHAESPAATMFAAYTPGSTDQRTLEPDDREAICTVYPNRAQRLTASGLVPSTACNLAPSEGGGCGDPSIVHGCTMGIGEPGSLGGVHFGAFGAVWALAGWRRRRAKHT